MSLAQQAAANPRQLYQGQPGTSVSTLYTAPAASANVTSTVAGTSASSGSNGSATAYITEIVICNTTGNNATITIYLVPSGGTAGVSNALLYNLSVPPNDTKYLSDNKTYMPAGSTIQALQGTSGAITLTISGVEVQ